MAKTKPKNPGFHDAPCGQYYSPHGGTQDDIYNSLQFEITQKPSIFPAPPHSMRNGKNRAQ